MAFRKNSPWSILTVLAILACHVALGLSAAATKSVTGDESAHLAGGVSYWKFHDYRLQPNNGNWPQRLCGLPLWWSGYTFPLLDSPAWQAMQPWDAGDQFLFECGNDADAVLARGRAMTSVLSVVLGLIIYLWSSRIFDQGAGLASLVLYAFSPAVLAHGFLVTTDLASALGFTAAVGALWLLLHEISVGTLLATWLALSALFLSKFSAPIIVPIAAGLVAVRLLNPSALPVHLGTWHDISGRRRQLLVLFVVTVVLALGTVFSIWASFGFRYSMLNPAVVRGGDSVPWDVMKSGSRDIDTAIAFARDHHLLPEAYLYGFVHTLHSMHGSNAFLNGQLRNFGWWSFFPYCMFVKAPLELFVLVVAAVAALAWFRRKVVTAQSGDENSNQVVGRCLLYELTPLVMQAGVYFAFAFTSHVNLGQRHVLPVYPPLFIICGASAWWFRPMPSAHHAPIASRLLTAGLRVIVALGLALSIIEAIACWPNYLAYFNAWDGGPAQAYRHLADSSLDWSQDLKGIRRWLDEHPEDARDEERVYLSFFGSAPTKYYGIHARHLPFYPDRREYGLPRPLGGGTYLVSATMLNGVFGRYAGRWNRSYEEQYQAAKQNIERYLAEGAADSATQEARGGESAKASPESQRVLFREYEQLRFARLASFLRQREPDDEIGYSILVYRLADADLAAALDGPPTESLPRPELEQEVIRRGAKSQPDP